MNNNVHVIFYDFKIDLQKRSKTKKTIIPPKQKDYLIIRRIFMFLEIYIKFSMKP